MAEAEDVRCVDGRLLVYVKEGSSAIAPTVLRLSEAGLSVDEISLARPSLDDVFLRKTGHHLQGDGASPEGDAN
jgi:ABC-2 type transport system ATP-binding protein